MENCISKNQFAKDMGVDEKLIRRAIIDGKIKLGVVLDGKGREWINPEVAKAEFVSSLNVRRLRSKSTQALANSVIDYSLLKENQVVIEKPLPEVVNEKPKAEKKRVVYEMTDEERLDAAYEAARKTTQHELSTQKLRMEVEREEINLKKLKGEMIELKDIRSSLYDAGVEIRSSLLSVPDRIVDSILAATDRHEALQVMKNEFSSVLKTLSGLHTKDLRV